MVAVGTDQRENPGEQGSRMADAKPLEASDWIVPAVLVGAIVALALVVVIVLAVQASDEQDDTIAGQLETWSLCLRTEGANVPLVETLRGGGFRITVDGSFVDDGIDETTLRPALDECQAQAPEGVERLMTFVDGFDDFGFLGDVRGPRVPRIQRQLEQLDFSEICDLIEGGELDPSSAGRRLLRACSRDAVDG